MDAIWFREVRTELLRSGGKKIDPVKTVKLLLASMNTGKLREFREAAEARDISVESLPGIQDLPACLEDGRTFEENARKKALHYSSYVQGLVFADDSGISADALGGAPGVYSARWSGPQADDAANNEKLLRELNSSPAQDRNAHYACVIALAESGRILTVVEGRTDGTLLDHPRGRGGFGYDPLFLYPRLGKTFAELTPEQKFAVSHRGQAFRKLLDYLRSIRRTM
jgi:XTP/dITP diphosphohydrolase